MTNTPKRTVRGVRDTIPPGFVMGRVGSAAGPVQLIPIQGNFTSPGYVANTTVQVNGPAGGDLSGTYPNPTVAKIQGTAVKATPPTDGQIPVYVNANLDIEWETKGFVPPGGTVGQELVKNSNTDFDTKWVTPAGGSGGGATSIQDDGTNVYIALSDTDGQLVLDGSGDPIFSIEVFSLNAIPNLPASQITSGTLAAARLPNPTASTLGGIESIVAVAHEWIDSISTAGVPHQSQPSTADISDYAQGTWTPIDASGAGLTFSTADGIYIRIGKLIFVSGRVTFPSTANGASVLIGGLPFTLLNSDSNFVTFSVQINNSIATQGLGIINSTTFEFVQIGTQTALTNAQCTLQNVRFTFVYQSA